MDRGNNYGNLIVISRIVYLCAVSLYYYIFLPFWRDEPNILRFHCITRRFTPVTSHPQWLTSFLPGFGARSHRCLDLSFYKIIFCCHFKFWWDSVHAGSSLSVRPWFSYHRGHCRDVKRQNQVPTIFSHVYAFTHAKLVYYSCVWFICSNMSPCASDVERNMQPQRRNLSESAIRKIAASAKKPHTCSRGI